MAKQSPRDNADQYRLDWSSKSADQIRRLERVLRANRGDLHQWDFLKIVHKYTRDRGFKISVSKLARMLWCSDRTVRRVIERLDGLGILIVAESENGDGGDAANEYRINWDAVDRMATAILRREYGEIAFPADGGPPCQSVRGPCQSVRAPGQSDSAYKEQPISGIVSGTISGPEGNPAGPGLQRMRILDDDPALAQAARRAIAPREAGNLAESAWRTIEQADLTNGRLIEWHQRQLSLPSPVAGGTEADLILVLAAGLYVHSLPRNEIRSSRVGFFVWIVQNGEYERVRGKVPQALGMLDDLARERFNGRRPWLAAAEVATA